MIAFTNFQEASESLSLPKGRLGVKPEGMCGFTRSFTDEEVLQCAQALLNSGKSFVCATQSGVIVKAQVLGVAMPVKEYGELRAL